MIEGYLDAGELYALMVNGKTCAVAVVTAREEGAWEIKNLAVTPDMRGKGYGARMLRHLFKVLSARCGRLYVGTSEGNVPFYEHFGFVRDGLCREGFFTDNYPEPIIEDGRVADGYDLSSEGRCKTICPRTVFQTSIDQSAMGAPSRPPERL